MIYYRELFTTIGLILVAFAAQAQYEISGNIVDGSTGEPVPYANVALYTEGENTVQKGATSDDSGRFTLTDVAEGEYDLEIKFVGYKAFQVEDVQTNQNIKLGTIKMSKSVQELNEVVVEGKAVSRPVETTLEGMMIRPEQNLSNVGGSALDVLRNTPSVIVGQDGGLTIRGSNSPNILINGRNSSLSNDLAQLPASAIKSISIVTNPDAKYDAQGTGGVINIQLKKGSRPGTHGKMELTLGNRYRVNGSARLNHQTKKFNVFGGYNYRSSPSIGSSSSVRETFGENPQTLQQKRRAERDDASHNINYGLDYYFYNSTLSYEGVLELEDERDIDITNSRITTPEGEQILYNERNSVETEDNFTMDNALIYQRQYDREGQDFRVSLSHSYRDDQELQNTTTTSLDNQEVPSTLQRAFNDRTSHVGVGQIDYVRPFDNDNTLEVGAKSTMRWSDTDFRFENFDEATQNWLNNLDVSNRFVYSEQVHAVYGIYSQTLGAWQLSAGSRIEHTRIDTELKNTNEVNDQRYLNIFPSAKALYVLDDQNTFKFTYSRRIDRPNPWRLNPFPDISDTLNVRLGNPKLRPEFIQSLELGHKLTLPSTDLTSNLFYRRVNGLVDWVVEVEDNGVSTRRPTNLASGTTFGLELITTSQINEWWDINGSVSFFRSIIDGTNVNNTFSNEAFAWNAKFTSSFALPADINMQLTGNYEAPEAEAQGFDDARYYADVSFQRDFGEKSQVSVSVRDVFNTYQFGSEARTEEFRQYFVYKRDSRRIYVTYSYAF
uniref:Outer membrane beta-barrel family protein n=1 Tax=Roseihalotalea indica TaxID=2867963 RepID=A0AA49GTP7_9BACT|nr:outer membrane beta-barrel family protein [Tunicatimonas sp. TK19036]